MNEEEIVGNCPTCGQGLNQELQDEVVARLGVDDKEAEKNNSYLYEFR